MGEEPEEKGAFYRGVKLDYAWIEDYWFTTLEGERLRADTLPEMYDLIDAILGPFPEEAPPEEIPEPWVPPLERVEVYLRCSIYLETATGIYSSPCVPYLLGSHEAVKKAIEAFRGIEPEEEVPEEEIIPVELVEAPALPFYAAWLAPIVEYMGALTANVINYGTLKLAPLKAGIEALVTLPGDIIGALNEGLPGLVQKTRNKGTDIAVVTLREVLSGTELWMDELATELETAEAGILGEYTGAVTGALKAMEEGDTAKAAEALDAMKTRILQASIVNFALHAAMEAGTLGQIEFMKDLDPMVISKLGLDQIIARATLLPIEKAVLTPAEQHYNRLHPHELPAPAELIQMVIKEVITLDDFKAAMQRQGIAEGWSQAIWDAHFIPPSYTEIRQALYRGIVTREEFESLKTLVDLDPRFKAIWDGLLVQIPPVSELINQRVREVLTQEQFEEFLGWYGYPKEWATRIWDAHFLPPNLNDLLTAWRRGVIDTERLDELMIIVDLDPRFKEIFDTRRYVDPSITQARFMFETGAIDEARVREIILRNGYTEDDTTDLTRFIVKFQERRFRTSYLRGLATGAVYGAFTPEEVHAAVKEAGYTEAVAEWLIKAAEVREATVRARLKAPAPKLLSLGDIKRAYRTDIIDQDVFRRELTLRNYETGDIDIMATLLDEQKVTAEAGGRKIALSQSELLNAWRYEEVTEDHVRVELALRGMEQDEINILLATKKKQWGQT